MSDKSKREYLKTVRVRYRACKSRKEKSALVSEVTCNLRVNRKSAIRALNQEVFVRRKPVGARKRKYGFDLTAPLKKIWEVAGYPCSKRLRPQIPELIDKLKDFKEISLYNSQEKLLRQMSSFTIDNLLFAERKTLKGHGLSGTRQSPLLKSLIPVRMSFEDTTEPGNIEADCVLHCGESLTGIYAETLNMLDIATHWNEKQMILRKTKSKIVAGFHTMRKQFPFKVNSVDFDNGGEFVNWFMYNYCQREDITFTRCRSYHKNDQAHIEGKNYQSVRRVTGYGRIESERIVDLFNSIYRQEHRLLTNFFYTTLKLKSKKRLDGKVVKTYETAKTPYQRCLESGSISEEEKQKLKVVYKTLNPAALQRTLEKKLVKLKQLVG